MRVRYDIKEDILTIVFGPKKGQKIDDTYEMEHGYVSVDEAGRPVMIDIFNAKIFFTEESKILPNEIKEKFFATS